MPGTAPGVSVFGGLRVDDHQSNPPVHQEAPATEKYHPGAAELHVPRRIQPSRRATLPVRLSSRMSAAQRSPTANAAIESYQRRKVIIDFTYHAAVEGSDKDIAALKVLNTALVELQDQPASGGLSVTCFEVSFQASDLEVPERNWLARYETARSVLALMESRMINSDDYEAILTELFPAKGDQLVAQEYLEVYLSAFVEEAVMSRELANQIATLRVASVERDAGAHYTGPVRNRYSHRLTYRLHFLISPGKPVKASTLMPASLHASKPRTCSTIFGSLPRQQCTIRNFGGATSLPTRS